MAEAALQLDLSQESLHTWLTLIEQEFSDNCNGRWRGEYDYVVNGRARSVYPASKGRAPGAAPTAEAKNKYTRDLGHDGWTVQDFVKAQPKELRGTDSELTEAEVILLRLYTGYNPSHPRPHLP